MIKQWKKLAEKMDKRQRFLDMVYSWYIENDFKVPIEYEEHLEIVKADPKNWRHRPGVVIKLFFVALQLAINERKNDKKRV